MSWLAEHGPFAMMTLAAVWMGLSAWRANRGWGFALRQWRGSLMRERLLIERAGAAGPGGYLMDRLIATAQDEAERRRSAGDDDAVTIHVDVAYQDGRWTVTIDGWSAADGEDLGEALARADAMLSAREGQG